MTDRNNVIGEGAFGPEPPRDMALGALLREGMGTVPMAEVDWNTLANRISARIAAHAASPWWAYAARWERRMVPVALVAGIAAVIALVNIEVAPAGSPSFVSASSVSTAIVSGTPFEDAAVSFAHSVTSTADITAGVPE
jgi:hypothetical protein